MVKFRPRSEFLEIMESRGFLSDVTDFQPLDALMRRECVTAYIGFDATAPSLHVGSLIQIMMLRWLQKSGHRPIVLMGGGTTKVGDPSFRSSERPLLGPDQIDTNIEGIKSVFSKYINFGESGTGAILANNAEWLDDLNYLEFLREVGRYFSVNRMLSFDSVKSRLEREQSLSFLEFNYMILQAYDFLELNRRYSCRLQMGGSDQWGNIVNGVDLTRRIENRLVFGLTSPLLTTSGGEKMGKTSGGAVWLNPSMYSPYEFWQFWRSVGDADVHRFLLLFTEIPIDECRRLGALKGSEINESKIVLANSATELAHGKEAAQAAAATAHEVFDLGGTGDELPKVELDPEHLRDGKLPVVQAFVLAGLSASGKAGRRLIAGGGARINDKQVSDPGQMLSAQELAGPLKLSAGKKRHAIVLLPGRLGASKESGGVSTEN
ncbi:MAG: tyrosine--tRNA ligase [Albidovulum sp.]|nr:tyrosine--tRNA ligase [Albidovulum sp.]